MSAGVPVGPHLADQLLIALALAGGGTFRTVPLTSHAQTNMQVLKAFVDVDVQVRELNGNGCEVRIRQPPHSGATPAG